MSYLAKFQCISGHLFRFDTRIYLDRYDLESGGVCVGAVIGKNPGSAKPTRTNVFEPLSLDGDKMLPSVRNRFRDAYRSQGKVIPRNVFVRVWNLLYVCSPNLDNAKSILANFEVAPTCPTEDEEVPLVWFGWGGNDSTLNPYKERFLQKTYRNPFFYHNGHKAIINRMPGVSETAKHTQGMPKDPVAMHLAKII